MLRTNLAVGFFDMYRNRERMDVLLIVSLFYLIGTFVFKSVQKKGKMRTKWLVFHQNQMAQTQVASHLKRA